MKRLRRDYKKRFASAAMAASMLATMLPFSAVAYAIDENNSSKDISITWGEKSTTTDAETGITTGSVELSATLNNPEIQSAEVKIKLDAAEAEALEAGTAKEKLEEAGITLEEPEQEEPTPEPEPEPGEEEKPEEEIGDGINGDGGDGSTEGSNDDQQPDNSGNGGDSQPPENDENNDQPDDDGNSSNTGDDNNPPVGDGGNDGGNGGDGSNGGQQSGNDGGNDGGSQPPENDETGNGQPDGDGDGSNTNTGDDNNPPVGGDGNNTDGDDSQQSGSSTEGSNDDQQSGNDGGNGGDGSNTNTDGQQSSGGTTDSNSSAGGNTDSTDTPTVPLLARAARNSDTWTLTFTLSNDDTEGESKNEVKAPLTFQYTGKDTLHINISTEDIEVLDSDGNKIKDANIYIGELDLTLKYQEPEPGVPVAENSITAANSTLAIVLSTEDTPAGTDDTTPVTDTTENGNTTTVTDGTDDTTPAAQSSRATDSAVTAAELERDFKFDVALQFPENKDDAYQFALTLPDGATLTEGELSVGGADNTDILAGNTPLATFKPTPGVSMNGASAVISDPQLEDNTLSFDLRLTGYKSADGENTESEEDGNGEESAIETKGGEPTDEGDEPTEPAKRGVKGTLTFHKEAFTVDLETLFSGADDPVIALSATAPDGTYIDAAEITLTAPQVDPEYEAGDLVAWGKTVLWYNGTGQPPVEYGMEDDKYHPAAIHYTITKREGDGTVVDSGTLNDLTQQELGFSHIKLECKKNDKNGFVINFLPHILTQTNVYGNQTVYNVEWTLKPMQWPGYALKGDEGDETWTYTQLKEFSITLDLRNGNRPVDAANVIKLIKTQFQLYQQIGNTGEPVLVDNAFGEDGYDVSYDAATGKITISGLPAYSTEKGTENQEIYYSLREIIPDGEEQDYELGKEDVPDGMLPSEDEVGEGDDYFEITYNNKNVANSGGMTDRVFDGGTLTLALAGTTQYKATKVWLDNNATDNRPTATFVLWRYIYKDEDSWKQASQLTYDSLAKDGIEVDVENSKDFISMEVKPETSADENLEQQPAENTDPAGPADSGTGEEQDGNTVTIQFTNKNGKVLDLPKYDPDGYRYIYVVRETLTGANADKYVPVFGNVNPETGVGENDIVWPDELNGYRDPDNSYLYNTGTLTNRRTDKTTATVKKVWKAAAYQASLEDIAVEFELRRKTEGEDEDEWEIVTETDGKNITLVLHDFYAEKMEDSGSVGNLPRYDANGEEYQYQWFEIAVYQGVELDSDATQAAAKAVIAEAEKAEQSEDAKGNIIFTLEQSLTEGEEQEVGYISTSTREGNTTTITNTIDGEIDYAVKKTWLPGAVIDDVTINIYQVPNGEGLNLDEPYVSFTIPKEGGSHSTTEEQDAINEEAIADGVTIETGWACTEGSTHTNAFNEEFTSEGETDITDWDAVVQRLPKYDEDGRLLEYVLLEKDGFPTYETKYFEDGCYATNVINGPGPEYRIMVQKVWQDDGDVQHREPVTVQAYYMDGETPTKIGAPLELGTDGMWHDFITFTLNDLPEEIRGDGTEDADEKDDKIIEWIKQNVFVVETNVGEHFVKHNADATGTDVSTPADKAEWEAGHYGENKNNIFSVETGNHRYQVTYKQEKEAPAGAHALYTVYNRRLGHIDLTVEKTWRTGGQQDDITKQVAEMLAKIKQAGKPELALAFMLEFANQPKDAKWEITYNGANDTVRVGGLSSEAVQIMGADGETAASSVQPVIDASMTTDSAAKIEAHFFNLPKYAGNGLVVKYTVKEVWVEKQADGKWQMTDGDGDGQLDGKLPSGDTYKALRDYWDDFTVQYGATQYTPDVDDSSGDGGEGKVLGSSNAGLRDQDAQTVTVTNRRQDSIPVTWYKEWRDNFANNAGNRPDIYLDIYALTHKGGKDGKAEITRVTKDYQWSTAERVEPSSGDNGAVINSLSYTPAGAAAFSSTEITVEPQFAAQYMTAQNTDTPSLLDDTPEETTVDAVVVADKDNDTWSVTINGLPEFDDNGNQIEYFAVERTKVRASDFDYQAVQYSLKGTHEIFGNRDGEGKDEQTFDENTLDLLGDYKSEEGTIPTDDIGKYVTGNETTGGTYPRYALRSGNTFVNTLKDDYTITGHKIWNELPQGYLTLNGELPTVKFKVYQLTQKNYEEWAKLGTDAQTADFTKYVENGGNPIGSLTIETGDWAKLNHSSNQYDFKITHTGNTTIAEDGTGENLYSHAQDAERLRFYKPETGEEYVYLVREEVILDDTPWDTPENENKELYTITQPGASTNVTCTNTYDSPEGGLGVKKILTLPKDTSTATGGFPTIVFKLTRSYTKNDGTKVVDTGFSREGKLQPSEYTEKFNAAVEAAGNNDTVTFDAGVVTFNNLPIYAPNGSKYEYKVTETALGGYETYATQGDIAVDKVETSFQGQTGTTTAVPGLTLTAETAKDPGASGGTGQGTGQGTGGTGEGTGDKPTIPGDADNPGGGEDEPTGDDIPVKATFWNKRIEQTKQQKVTLVGKKDWEDYNNTMGTRPDGPKAEDDKYVVGDGTNSKDPLGLVVTRTSQKGNGPETLQLVEDYKITYEEEKNAESQKVDAWKFTIEGKKEGELEKYASDGTLWIYTVTETAKSEGYTNTVPSVTGGKYMGGNTDPEEIQLGTNSSGPFDDKLVNSLHHGTVYFDKKWVDEQGNSITKDHLGLELTVTFQLQVREKGSTDTWKNAGAYFTENVPAAAEAIENAVRFDRTNKWEEVPDNSFAVTISGRVNDGDWSGQFINLPGVIKVKDASGNDRIIDLEYRVVETKVSYNNGANSQTFTQGAANDDGSFDYTVEQGGTGSLVTGATYAKDATTGTIKHVTTNTLSALSVTVEKQWEDNKNAFHERPNSRGDSGFTWEAWFVLQRTKAGADEWDNVQLINLYGGDANTKDGDDTANAHWTETISGLPAADFAGDGEKYTYRVRELKPKLDATGKVVGYSGLGDVEQKDLVGHNDTYAQAGNFEYTATYSTADGQFTAGANHVTVTNTIKRDLEGFDSVSVTVKKEWKNQNNNTAPDGETVTVQLQYQLEDGNWDYYSAPATLTAGNKWTHEWTNIPTVIGGQKVVDFNVVETGYPQGYVPVEIHKDFPPDGSDGIAVYTFMITNAETTAFDVEKVWNNGEEVDPTEPVTVGLYRTTVADNVGTLKGEKVPTDELETSSAPQTKQLKSENEWKANFEKLPKFDESGTPYYYYALELDENDEPIAAGGRLKVTDGSKFHVAYNNEEDGKTTITNTPTTDISGSKTWDDDNNQYNTRPEREDFKQFLKLWRTTDGTDWTEVTDLAAEGIELAVTESGVDNQWTYKFSSLPMYDPDGDKYTYKVTETNPTGYEQMNSGDGVVNGAVGPNFTNKLTGDVTIKGTKTWKGAVGDPDNPPELTLERTTVENPDETVWETVTVGAGQPKWSGTDTSNWTYAFTHLEQKDENGTQYTYRVTETVPDGYNVYYEDGEGTVDETGGTVTVENLNIRNVKQGSMKVTKEVTGNRGDTTHEFPFTVTFTLPADYDFTINGTPDITCTAPEGKTVEVEWSTENPNEGTASFELKHGESITFNGLPGDTAYSVEETDPYGHTVTYDDNRHGEIPAGGTAATEVVNYKHRSGGGNPPPEDPDEEIPDDPTPTDPVDPDDPDDPDEPDDPDYPDEPDDPDDPGEDIPDNPTPTDPTDPDDPDEPDEDIPDDPTPGGNTPAEPPKQDKPGLPQTGQLWWPVWMLAAAGLLLTGTGVWKLKKYRGKHGKRHI